MNDPLVDMMTSTPAPAPEPVAAPVAPDNGAVAVAPASPESTSAEATPAPPPAVIPDLGPEPTIPGSDPMSQLLGQVELLRRQNEALAARINGTQQPRQQPKPDPTAVDDLLDETPAWARKLEQTVMTLEQRQEAQRKMEEGARTQGKIQSELAGAKSILDETAQQFQITKEYPKVHGLITNFLGGQIQAVVEKNPFGHGLTRESVQTAYAQLAQQVHQVVAEVISKRAQVASQQVKENASTTALTGGTSPPVSAGPKHTGDLLTNENYWNKEVDILLNSAVAKVTGQ